MKAFVAAAGAAGATTLASTRPDVHAAGPSVEPVPTSWAFERFSTDMDCCTSGVARALVRLGWASGMEPQPLLCVHPAQYATAIQIAANFGGVVQVWATRDVRKMYANPSSDVNPFLYDEDHWCVAWRGRLVGSIGA